MRPKREFQVWQAVWDSPMLRPYMLQVFTGLLFVLAIGFLWGVLITILVEHVL